MVASSEANLFASVASGVCALWGPLHGGANQAAIEMLGQIHCEGDDGSRFIEAAKDKKSGRRLMGFGHRVYKNYDPRAKLIKKQCDELLGALKISDPLLDIALRLEQGLIFGEHSSSLTKVLSSLVKRKKVTRQLIYSTLLGRFV
jgi:citrate synthase